MGILPESADQKFCEMDSRDYPTETFLIDHKNARISKKGDGLEAMRQAVTIALNTERYLYQIYSPDFGHELNQLIGKPPEYVMSMVKRRVKEALVTDKRILGVDNFSFRMEESGRKVRCGFDVKTVFGTVTAEVKL